jgi:hypothetical protein
MGLRKNNRKYLRLHPYRRHTSTPTHFLPQVQCPLFSGISLPPARRGDGVGTAIMGICPIFESGLFDDPH